MLEDDYSDVIRKAMVGCGIEERQLAAWLEVAPAKWQEFLAGGFDANLARRVAQRLQLSVEAMAGHPIYHPRPVEVAGVRRLELPFGSWGVNAWWVECGDARLVFDAGTGPMDLVEALPATPQTALITHGHRDHVGGLDALRARGVPILTPESLQHGQVMNFGALRVRACDLSGHCVPALGYQIEGLERPVLVVGDALFAGTMGKTPDPERYQQALRTLNAALEGLSDDAVLLPGHGPATTVAEEKTGNPFLVDGYGSEKTSDTTAS